MHPREEEEGGARSISWSSPGFLSLAEVLAFKFVSSVWLPLVLCAAGPPLRRAPPSTED